VSGTPEAAPSEAATSKLSFSELVFSDLGRYRPDEKPSWLRVLARCAVLPGMIASIIIRAQQCLFRAGHVRAAHVLRTVGVLLVNADFVPGMEIGTGLLIAHPVGVTIGNRLRIGNNVTLAGGVTVGARNPDGSVHQEFATIDDGAIILANAVLVGGVRIGKHAQVGANSVVLSDVADHAVVFGVPARKVGTRETALGDAAG
jgi:serine O-acetyltransferase